MLGNRRERTAVSSFPPHSASCFTRIDFRRGLDSREEEHVRDVKSKSEKRMEKQDAFSVGEDDVRRPRR